MKILEILKVYKTPGSTYMIWHRFNDDNFDQNDIGIWPVYADFNDDEVLNYARLHCDKDITVKYGEKTA